MNKCTIIGRLTRDPEVRTVKDGITVCTFTVAVNRRHGAQAGKEEADFFRVTAWRGLGELCGKFLMKGRQACVIGAVSVSAYSGKDGQIKANLELTADEVEFLGSATAEAAPAEKRDAQTGFVQVDDEKLPWEV